MSQTVEITKENVEEWKSFIKKAIQLLDLHRGLLDTYVLDFFTEDIWSSINHNWRDVLGVLSPKQLAQFLSREEKLKQESVWPLSLQALRAAAFTYSLPRKSIPTDIPFIQYLQRHTQTTCTEASSACSPNVDTCDRYNEASVANNVSCKGKCNGSDSSREDETEANVGNVGNLKERKCSCREQTTSCNKGLEKHIPLNGIHIKDNCDPSFPLHHTTVTWGSAASELSPEAGQHKLLQHVFRRHLKPKKQHEVARLAYIAGKVAHQACEGVMVDVGSGQGHLSRFLAYGHEVRVVCLEAQDEFIKGAKKFDSQLEMAVEKMKRSKKQDTLPPLPPAPRHAVCHLDVNMDPSVFKEVVVNTWPELNSQRGVCGLLGLHTCGNLASTLLRIFTNLSMCQALVSVGCCYMKLNENCNSIECLGYPMSEFVKSVPGNSLSYEAREVACHAIEMYVDRLQLGAENLKVHCYRAALEEIIVKHWPEHHHAGLRSVNHAHKMDFAEYAVAAVNRLENVKLSQEDLSSEKTKHNLSRWMQVVVYYSLRLLLAPVVESVVLLDRLLFLYEKGTEGILLPAFDPLLSPRNHVLIAIKPQNRS